MNRSDYISNIWIKPIPGEIDQLPEDIIPGSTAYKLIGRKVYPCDITEADFGADGIGKRRVARDEFENGAVSVSTVFLVINHSWSAGPPMLFETMIFGGPHADYQTRCSTYHEAEIQHQKALEMIR